MLKRVSDEQLRVYVVWIPALFADDQEDAVEAAAEFADPRVSHFWDKRKEVGKSFGRTLEIPIMAWDVYLLFGESAQFGVDAPMPMFWMHQLTAAGGRAPHLDEEGLRHELIRLVE